MKRLIVLTAMVGCFTGIAWGQNLRISGRVYARDGGFPIEYMAVKVKGTNASVVTNNEGCFLIWVPRGGAIVFRMIGYEPQEVKIKNGDTLHVVMEDSKKQEEEEVVTQKKRSAAIRRSDEMIKIKIRYKINGTAQGVEEQTAVKATLLACDDDHACPYFGEFEELAESAKLLAITSPAAY